MKTLILYYTYSQGNTEKIANELKQALNADIEKIETEEQYKGSYDEVVEQGKREVEDQYQPSIKSLNKNIADYDRIIIGTPTWWYTMAPAIRTLLNEYSFEDKDVILFQTHAGWGGHTLIDMDELCRGAKVLNSKAIQFDSDGGSDTT